MDTKTCFILFAFLINAVFTEVPSIKFKNIEFCEYYIYKVGINFVCTPSIEPRDFFTECAHVYCKSYNNEFYNYDKTYLFDLSFENCSMTQLPAVFKSFKHIYDANLTSMDLEVIRSNDFDDAHSLRVADISHNRITELPSSLFDGAENIEKVDFSFNKIHLIDPFAFRMRKNLSVLNLKKNLITTLDTRTFADLPKLKTLDLSHNFIANIDSGLYINLVELRTLKLENNQFKQVHCEVSRYFASLQSIDIPWHELKELNDKCYEVE